MSARRAEVVQLWFHLSLLLLQVGSTDEATGDLPESESMGPSYAKVGPGHGLYRGR